MGTLGVEFDYVNGYWGVWRGDTLLRSFDSPEELVEWVKEEVKDDLNEFLKKQGSQ